MTDTEPNFQVLIIHFLGNYRIIRWTFVSKEMSLLLNMFSMSVMAFVPRSKRVLITWFQSPFEVILETPKRKSLTVSIVSPSICHEVMRMDAMILAF